MANPFDALNDKEQTDDRYMDRVEFFLSLKQGTTKEAAAPKKLSRDKTKDLLDSKGVRSVKLKAQLSGRSQRPANISKNYDESAASVGKRRNNAPTSEIKKPEAISQKGNADVTQANKNKLKKLLSKKV